MRGRAWIAALALAAASCADFRTFRCPHCTQATHAKEPGESICQSCLRVNVWAVCPACGGGEPIPDLGPYRCGACRTPAFAAKCPTCSAIRFSREPGVSCDACARRSAPSTAELKRTARAHADRGAYDPAIDAYVEVLRLDPGDTRTRYALACVLARAGRTERALDELERAAAEGYANGDLLRKDPDLAPLRAHPRWRRLMAGAPE